MNKEEWITKVKENRADLIDLIHSYHPAMGAPKRQLPITAHDAEMACEYVRNQIKIKEADKPNPIIIFDEAIENSNISEIYNILSSTWFGVPESTLCWRIKGFSVAVYLIDDPPDEIEAI